MNPQPSAIDKYISYASNCFPFKIVIFCTICSLICNCINLVTYDTNKDKSLSSKINTSLLSCCCFIICHLICFWITAKLFC